MRLSAVTYLVRDYDEAIAWFQHCLNFELLEDTKLTDEKRWVRIAPPNAGTCLLLARADTEAQNNAIGKAAGDRVAFFLFTDDFAAKHAHMIEAGVHFLEQPRNEVYGIVAVFTDLYGNKWDLIEPKSG
jgi:catechol 2,3-dioxygenase-like lactoylglutathione lyase family enzyme